MISSGIELATTLVANILDFSYIFILYHTYIFAWGLFEKSKHFFRLILISYYNVWTRNEGLSARYQYKI
jgi:hypothetical protein